MNLWKILSTVSIVLAIGCWFTLAIAGFTGALNSDNGLPPLALICFIGFALFAILSGVFANIGKKLNPLDSHVGSSQGIDSLTPLEKKEEKPKVEVKVRCAHCGTLNDEDAAYCKHCGTHL
jgi:ribosomal protein L40E